ncbi:hypothetical protein ACJ5H2_06910 [Nocardioides sp. R1-1]|uniref:hypothetical protein n=1 Tax=Nocardioides sp. R1-1 TaxID=3383502 RepID=UPI0038D16265
MEILLWLLPAAALTLASMAWVAWWGREGRGEVDRETAARRLGEALTREQASRPGYAAPKRRPERHTGVALRASQTRPSVVAGAGEQTSDASDPQPDRQTDGATGDRRAS